MKKNKKIAIVSGIFFPKPGGAQVQTHNLANCLIQKNNLVDCYVFEKFSKIKNNYKLIVFNRFILSSIFILKYYFNINLTYFLTIYLSLIQKKEGYDCWHFNFINYKSLILINALKNINTKIFVTFQGIDIQKDKSINYGYRFDKKYEKYLISTLNCIDLFFNISENVKSDLLSLGVKNKKIIFTPNCVNINKFNSINVKKEITKKIKLITVARYSEKKKGFDLVPKIAQLLIKQKINFIWNIVGKNVNKLKKHNIIKNNPNNFNLIDNIDNENEEYFPSSKLIKHYKKSDLYVNLSRIESFGITFVESLASAVPVITFNTKGANEIIIHNRNGIIIKKKQNILFSKKLIDLIQNKQKIVKLKSNSCSSINRYSLSKIADKLISFY